MDKLFAPKSVAVIGASNTVGSVGHGIIASLKHGGVFASQTRIPFSGAIYPINPKRKTIQGIKAYASVDAISAKIDLAVIAVPAQIVPVVLESCGKKKIPYAIIISAGFGEVSSGHKLQESIVQIANKYSIRFVGPNCLGVISTHDGLNASFAPTAPPRGDIAFITQSGALADSIIDWSITNNYGMSKIISCGNQADLTVADYISYLNTDTKTKAIALYVEGLTDGIEFMKAARACTKPIIMLKAGRSKIGQQAVSSHTGSLAGSYATYVAAAKQSGVHVARTVAELFHFAKVLAYQPKLQSNSIAIITNGGGAGVLCTDVCEEVGLQIVPLAESTLVKLDESHTMHPAYSRKNPLDLVGDARPDRYKTALEILLSEGYISGVIVIQTLQTMTDSIADAQHIITAHKRYPDKPIICSFMGGKFSQKGVDILSKANIPNFSDVADAAKAMGELRLKNF